MAGLVKFLFQSALKTTAKMHPNTILVGVVAAFVGSLLGVAIYAYQNKA